MPPQATERVTRAMRRSQAAGGRQGCPPTAFAATFAEFADIEAMRPTCTSMMLVRASDGAGQQIVLTGIASARAGGAGRTSERCNGILVLREHALFFCANTRFFGLRHGQQGDARIAIW